MNLRRSPSEILKFPGAIVPTGHRRTMMKGFAQHTKYKGAPCFGTPTTLHLSTVPESTWACWQDTAPRFWLQCRQQGQRLNLETLTNVDDPKLLPTPGTTTFPRMPKWNERMGLTREYSSSLKISSMLCSQTFVFRIFGRSRSLNDKPKYGNNHLSWNVQHGRCHPMSTARAAINTSVSRTESNHSRSHT